MRRSAGFSLPELLVVLGMIGIIAFIAVPWFSRLMQHYRLSESALQVVSDLRYAQSLAVSNRAYYRIHWGYDPAVNQPNAYRIEKSLDGATWPAAAAGMGTDPNVISNWAKLDSSYPGVGLAAAKDASNTTLTAVVFNSQGFSINPAVAGFTNPVTVGMSTGDASGKTIQVRSTGSVKVQ